MSRTYHARKPRKPPVPKAEKPRRERLVEYEIPGGGFCGACASAVLFVAARSLAVEVSVGSLGITLRGPAGPALRALREQAKRALWLHHRDGSVCPQRPAIPKAQPEWRLREAQAWLDAACSPVPESAAFEEEP